MFETIRFRMAIKSDIPQLIDLMNSQYPRRRDESYFLWQFFNSYYPTILMCAFINAKLIGMFGLQKRKLESGANVGQAIDILVASEWRGKGIFKLLCEKTVKYFQDLDLLCVLPNKNGKKVFEKTFGWKTLSKINSMCLHKECSEGISKETLKAIFSDEKGHVYNKFDYSAETRTWRFDRHPEYKYIYIRLMTGEFAITKVFTDPVTGTRFGDIVDFECGLNDRKLLRELFLKASIQLKKQDVESITTWALPHTPLHEVVESLGFVETPQERYFCLQVLTPEYEYLHGFSRWHLVQSDAEFY